MLQKLKWHLMMYQGKFEHHWGKPVKSLEILFDISKSKSMKGSVIAKTEKDILENACALRKKLCEVLSLLHAQN